MSQHAGGYKNTFAGGTAKIDASGRQEIGGMHGLVRPQDVVVSKNGTQYNLSKQNYMLIMHNFT